MYGNGPELAPGGAGPISGEGAVFNTRASCDADGRLGEGRWRHVMIQSGWNLLLQSFVSFCEGRAKTAIDWPWKMKGDESEKTNVTARYSVFSNSIVHPQVLLCSSLCRLFGSSNAPPPLT